MPEDVFFVLCWEVARLMVDLAACEEEGDGYGALASVAWSCVIRAVIVLGVFVRLCVFSKRVLENCISDFWRNASIVER